MPEDPTANLGPDGTPLPGAQVRPTPAQNMGDAEVQQLTNEILTRAYGTRLPQRSTGTNSGAGDQDDD